MLTLTKQSAGALSTDTTLTYLQRCKGNSKQETLANLYAQLEADFCTSDSYEITTATNFWTLQDLQARYGSDGKELVLRFIGFGLNLLDMRIVRTQGASESQRADIAQNLILARYKHWQIVNFIDFIARITRGYFSETIYTVDYNTIAKFAKTHDDNIITARADADIKRARELEYKSMQSPDVLPPHELKNRIQRLIDKKGRNLGEKGINLGGLFNLE